jgi:ribosome-associated heat shock protein Hsp15
MHEKLRSFPAESGRRRRRLCETRQISPPSTRQSESSSRASARIDQWLWSTRLTKTRSDAASACRAGHVKVNGKTAKPSSPVRVGDRVEARLGKRERIVEVAQVVVKRVGASIAAGCYVDYSAPPPERPADLAFAARDRGAGRPTKRDRRRIDRLRGR